MPDPVTTLIATEACKKGLGLILSDVYESLKSLASGKWKEWKVSRSMDDLYKKMAVVRNVKTILQVEKEVDLASFYYPTKTQTGHEGGHTIHNLEDLAHSGNALVVGTVGQGKSIFFRYLAARELAKGRAIPVFVELRRLRAGQSLIEFLLAELGNLGLDMKEGLFRALCKAGKLVLFLDGFDEVVASSRMTVLSQIEDLWKRYEDNLRILLSTRPGTGVEGSTAFRVSRIAHIASDEYPGVIARFIDDPVRASQLIDGVKESAIAPVLTTPLMVALLVVRYRIEEAIPENEIAFFEDLFLLLIRRHDRYKGSYQRPRESKIGDSDLFRIFCCICYLARAKEETGHFSRTELCDTTREAMRLLVINGGPDAVVDDISGITNLIIEEAGYCRFVHRSVAEYHAAAFIKGLGLERARKFYSLALRRVGYWTQELRFLWVLDHVNYAKHYLIPAVRMCLDVLIDPWGEDLGIGASWEKSKAMIEEVMIIHDREGAYTTLPAGVSDERAREAVDPTSLGAEALTPALTALLREAEEIVRRHEAVDVLLDKVLE